MQKPPRWERQQPREWGKGTIFVEGDFNREVVKDGLKIVAVLLAVWALITGIFIITRG